MGDSPASPALHAMALLADPVRRPVDASRWVIVVAHPDDETLGIGSQLHRLHGARLVVVTDGAPRSGRFAEEAGFPDAASYAAARDGELQAALRAGDAESLSVHRLGVPDQEARLRLAELVRVLAPLLGDAQAVFTHAYEGGHPDHDAVAFAVHEAVARLPEETRPGIVEMPFYRAGEDGSLVAQDFAPVPGHMPVHLALTPEEVERKAAMMAAHASQAAVLARFDPHTERFREAPAHDFGALPNGGRLLYESYGWDMDGARWLELVRKARAALGRQA